MKGVKLVRVMVDCVRVPIHVSDPPHPQGRNILEIKKKKNEGDDKTGDQVKISKGGGAMYVWGEWGS